jgi:hypothetical protein
LTASAVSELETKEVSLQNPFNTLQFRGFRAALLLGVMLLMTEAAFSQVTPAAGFTPPDNTPTLKVGFTLYPTYTYQSRPQTTDTDGNLISPNNFDITRSYLNFTGNITHAITYRVTPDITRSSGSSASSNNSLVFRIKYAFAQFSLDDYTGNWKQTWVRVGANQTPFVDWEEGIYRYRFQGTVFSEKTLPWKR